MIVRPLAPHEGGSGARGSGVTDEVVSVETLAAHGDEEISRLDLSGIPLDSGKDRLRRDLAAKHSGRAGKDILERERRHRLAPVVDPSVSSMRRSATRNMAERARGLASDSLASGRTARRVIFCSRGR